MSSNFGPDRTAGHFVADITEHYGDNRHVRRVASWIGLIVLAIKRISGSDRIYYKRQIRFTFDGREFKGRYTHPNRQMPRGGIEIVEILETQGNPDGGTVFQMCNLRDAEQFYREAEGIMRRFTRP